MFEFCRYQERLQSIPTDPGEIIKKYPQFEKVINIVKEVTQTPFDPVTSNQDIVAMHQSTGAFPFNRLIAKLLPLKDLVFSDKPIV